MKTDSPALVVQALLTRICQIAYYEQLAMLNSPVPAATAFSLTAPIPLQWTGFGIGMVLVGIHSVIMVVIVVWFVRATRASLIGGYWQAVAQVVSDGTRMVLNEADRMDDGAVREWMRQGNVVESLEARRLLRSASYSRLVNWPLLN